MAGTIATHKHGRNPLMMVSMESGLDGRNNQPPRSDVPVHTAVSMESGLDGRNNWIVYLLPWVWRGRSQWSPA